MGWVLGEEGGVRRGDGDREGMGRGNEEDFEHTYATMGCSASGPDGLGLDWAMGSVSKGKLAPYQTDGPIALSIMLCSRWVSSDDRFMKS